MQTREDNRSPLYEQVYQTLLRELAATSPPANSPFLTENDAIKRFGVSRITVRRAFELLEREGHIYRIQGKGAFIAPSDIKPAKTVAFLATCILTSGVESVLLRAIEQYLDAHGINLIVCNTDNNPEKVASYIQRLSRSNVDAVFYVPATPVPEKDTNRNVVEYLWNRDIPVVLLDRYVPALEAQSYIVTPDNEGGARAAAEHLVALGHRRIGVVRVSHSTSTDERLAGIADALAEHGLGLRPEYMHEHLHEADFAVAAMRYQAMPDPPTALLALNDDLAYGIIDALRDRGLRVPEDLAVVGFDDFSMRKPRYPVELSTVRVPLWEEGTIAASMVVDLLEGRPLKPQHAKVRCEVVVRDTCGGRAGRRSDTPALTRTADPGSAPLTRLTPRR